MNVVKLLPGGAFGRGFVGMDGRDWMAGEHVGDNAERK